MHAAGMHCGETQAGLRHQCLDPSLLGLNQAVHTVAPLSVVQVFTGGAQCQVVDSEEEPEDGEEEVGRPCLNGYVCLAMLAGPVDMLATGGLILCSGANRRSSGGHWLPLVAILHRMSGVLHHSSFRVACMQSRQLSLGSAHVLASAALCVSSACLQTSRPRGSTRGMQSCRLRSVRGVAVLPTLQIVDSLRSPQLC